MDELGSIERGQDMQHPNEPSGQNSDHHTAAPAPIECLSPELPPATMVPISTLVLGSSPRLDGQDQEHVHRLAETGAELPPILVQRRTMQVIDGTHRVRAAQLNGRDTIAVQFYDGEDDDAFVISVERNIMHGMPLTRADRRAAAARIIKSHPHWSDRAIAARTGLSDRSVRAIRSTADFPHSNGQQQLNSQLENGQQADCRLGLDGRIRPLSTAEGRRRASEIITNEPGMPLRKVAEAAGVSLSTAHDVRQRMQRGLDPVPNKRDSVSGQSRPATLSKPSWNAQSAETDCLGSMLSCLTKDPSLKYTESGRSFLRWLNVHAIDNKDWEPFLVNLPDHCRHSIASIARGVAGKWQEFAREVENS